MPSHPSFHQTVVLSPGRHQTPEDGMCVMELSSVLAGDRFTDHPQSVCPTIAAFLRGYNDQLPDDCRQGVLLRWATEAVGTREADPAVSERRAEEIERFAHRHISWWRRSDWRYRGAPLWRIEYLGGRFGQWAGRRRSRHAAVDALLEHCSAVGSSPVSHADLSDAPRHQTRPGIAAR